MNPDEFDQYIQSQGFATSHKVEDVAMAPEQEAEIEREFRDELKNPSLADQAEDRAIAGEENRASYRDADDARRETEHEKSVERDASPAPEKPWFLRDETESARSAEHDHDHDHDHDR
jgi:hypothetical protein